jgi:hypothetical protein
VLDADHDGCLSASEAQTAPGSESTGGLRNPYYFWDFYDVWSHPLDQPNTWVRDRAVNVPGDILGVARRFGPGPQPPSNDAVRVAQALTPPTDDHGYHIAFDRGAAIGQHPWQKAPPDGSIDIVNDILGVAAQLGHTCG